ncbi:MAG: hypothetical protein K2K72_02770 [Duncaniella sp.]|nr:hypothetical protein [Duncaniella sp.]
MTKFFKSALMLVAALSASFSAFGEPVTEIRKWDFTQGWEHEEYVKDCGEGTFWKEMSNGRVGFPKMIMVTQLYANDGKTVLPGLEGIEFSAGANSAYGITDNFFFQGQGAHYMYIDNCGEGDIISVHFSANSETALVGLVPYANCEWADDNHYTTKEVSTDLTPINIRVKADGRVQINLSNSARLYDVTVTPAALLPKPVEPITTAREWDFTQGPNHADQIVCDSWAASSKGRYGLNVDLEDQELPGKDGVLTGLEGIYFTLSKGAVYGISDNKRLQNANITFRIPNCGEGDKITVHYCSGTKGKEVSLTANDEELDKTDSTSDSNTYEFAVKEAGDVTVKLSGNASRLNKVVVTPKTSGIDEIAVEAAEVVATRYYNLMGAPVDASYQGLVIKVETLSNGKIKTTKIAQ